MILLDTHAALWLNSAPEKLALDATRAISKASSSSGLARIIGATALVHDLPLVTKDRGLQASPLLRTVW